LTSRRRSIMPTPASLGQCARSGLSSQDRSVTPPPASAPPPSHWTDAPDALDARTHRDNCILLYVNDSKGSNAGAGSYANALGAIDTCNRASATERGGQNDRAIRDTSCGKDRVAKFGIEVNRLNAGNGRSRARCCRNCQIQNVSISGGCIDNHVSADGVSGRRTVERVVAGRTRLDFRSSSERLTKSFGKVVYAQRSTRKPAPTACLHPSTTESQPP
jgi:hypothetical protein